MQGSADVGGGIFRIAVEPETAPYGWSEYCKMCNVSSQADRALRLGAKDMGANHRQFFVSLIPVPRDKWIAFERFDFDRSKWVPASVVDMPTLERSRQAKGGAR